MQPDDKRLEKTPKSVNRKIQRISFLFLHSELRCNECAGSRTDSQDERERERVLTASKFSAGHADRGPGNRRNSTWCEKGLLPSPRLYRVWLPPTEAPLDSYLTFKYILCLLHFNTPVYSPRNPTVPPLPLLPVFSRFDSATFMRFICMYTYVYTRAHIMEISRH